MKIAISLPERTNEYQELQGDDAERTADRLGIQVEILDAGNSAVAQIQQLFQALRAKIPPDAIAVEPVITNGLESLLHKTASAGIGAALLNSTLAGLPRLRAAFEKVALFAVASDQVEIGRLQGRQLRALLPSGGQVLYLHGPQSAGPAQQRFLGFQEALKSSFIQPVILHGLWTEKSAEDAVRRWLRLRSSEAHRIEAVAAQDDSMARGARRAMRAEPELARRWREIPFLGIDGVPRVGQRLVDAGELTGTIVMPSNTGTAIEHLVEWRRFGRVPPALVTQTVVAYPEIGALAGHQARSA